MHGKVTQKAPALTKCPQCNSDGCGPLRCRFSMIEHSEYRRMQRRVKSAKHGVLDIDKRREAAYLFVCEKLGMIVEHVYHRAHSTTLYFKESA